MMKAKPINCPQGYEMFIFSGLESCLSSDVVKTQKYLEKLQICLDTYCACRV